MGCSPISRSRCFVQDTEIRVVMESRHEHKAKFDLEKVR